MKTKLKEKEKKEEKKDKKKRSEVVPRLELQPLRRTGRKLYH